MTFYFHIICSFILFVQITGKKRDSFTASINLLSNLFLLQNISPLSLDSHRILQNYPRLLQSFQSLLPTWIITNSNKSHIHRFFDSSPLSFSNRYLALTQTDDEFMIPDGESVYANIILIDLETGTEKIIYRTLAWDTQVGAHVQWGKKKKKKSKSKNKNDDNDDIEEDLYFNTILTENNVSRVVGVVYDITDNTIRYLECSIYHISLDGRYGISPSLEKIGYTQRGYGVNLHSSKPNSNSNDLLQDGIMVTNLIDGSCHRIVSLYHLAKIARIPTDGSVPIYGFHTKWSYDSKYIMVIIRSMEYSSKYYDRYVTKKRVRRQHLFVISTKFTTTIITTTMMTTSLLGNFTRIDHGSIEIYPEETRYLFSWASKSYYDNILKKIVNLPDGNHPNWIPNSYLISMNIASKYFSPLNRRNRWDQEMKKVDKIELITQNNTYLNCKWSLAILTIDSWPFTFQSNKTIENTMNKTLADHTITEIYPCSSGHPNYMYNGKYVIMDAYAKESHWFIGLKNSFNVPLRLINTNTSQSIPLLEIRVRKEVCSKKSKYCDIKSYKGNLFARDLSSERINRNEQVRRNSDKKNVEISIQKGGDIWRCDLHPAWSRDYQYIVLNGRVDGGNRQVLISYLHPKIVKLFERSQ